MYVCVCQNIFVFVTGISPNIQIRKKKIFELLNRLCYYTQPFLERNTQRNWFRLLAFCFSFLFHTPPVSCCGVLQMSFLYSLLLFLFFNLFSCFHFIFKLHCSLHSLPTDNNSRRFFFFLGLSDQREYFSWCYPRRLKGFFFFYFWCSV